MGLLTDFIVYGILDTVSLIETSLGTVIALFTQVVFFTAWIVRIDSRVKFLQKRHVETSERIDQITEKDIRQIESKLNGIFQELAEVNKKLAVIIDRQERTI